MMIGFTQGMLGLSDLAIEYMFKDDYNFSPSTSQALISITALPWIVKPFFGYISDTLPLFGYRRKTYLIMLGSVSALCWLHLSKFGI